MEKLSEGEIETRLSELPDWAELNGEIQRTYQFSGFVEAIAFVQKVADEAESAQHHPDIMIRYNKVTLTLTTHDAGGITIKDFDLANKADTLAAA